MSLSSVSSSVYVAASRQAGKLAKRFGDTFRGSDCENSVTNTLLKYLESREIQLDETGHDHWSETDKRHFNRLAKRDVINYVARIERRMPQLCNVRTLELRKQRAIADGREYVERRKRTILVQGATVVGCDNDTASVLTVIDLAETPADDLPSDLLEWLNLRHTHRTTNQTVELFLCFRRNCCPGFSPMEVFKATQEEWYGEMGFTKWGWDSNLKNLRVALEPYVNERDRMERMESLASL